MQMMIYLDVLVVGIEMIHIVCSFSIVQFVFSFLRHFGTGVSKFCEISICRRARALVLSVVTPWAWPLRARG